MTASTGHSETKKATINGLAVVGFGALIVGGILLALYASKYVPDALSRLSSAVVLSTDGTQNETDETDTPGEEPSNPIILFPNADDRDEEPADETPAAPAPTPTPAPAPTPSAPIYYPPQPVTPALYGEADLVLTNARIGYFRGSTFVEDDEVPSGRDAGVKFTVANRGTNSADGWRVRVDVTDEETATGNGGFLMPEGYQNFTLRIEDPKDGETLRVEIEVDYQDRVDESNERNNDRTLRVDIED